MFENPIYGSKALENDTNAMHGDKPIFCPSMAYGDCPYCDQCNLCHIEDPIFNCEDFGFFYPDWNE